MLGDARHLPPEQLHLLATLSDLDPLVGSDDMIRHLLATPADLDHLVGADEMVLSPLAALAELDHSGDFNEMILPPWPLLMQAGLHQRRQEKCSSRQALPHTLRSAH